MTTPVVRMAGIQKRFLEVVANDGVDLDLREGEVCALLGENGAGKTTLMNILFGILPADAGEIAVRGRPASLRSPRDAIALGIGMVHQHFALVPPHTVLENVIVGMPSGRAGLLPLAKARRRLAALAQAHGLAVNPDARIWQLSMGEQQRVEIIKALYRGADILILDEPTAVLTPQETAELFKTLRSLAREGRSIIFISHKLREVLEVSDRVVVLRNGRVVAARETAGTDGQELARLMVGREVERPERRPHTPGDVALEVRDLRVRGDRGLVAVVGVSFAVREGEILGLAGVSGNGQRELAEVIFGLRHAMGGRVLINGKDFTGRPSHEVVREGVGRIPEDRVGFGLLPELSLADNLILECYRSPSFARGLWLDHGAVAEYADRLIAEFQVRAPGRAAVARTLSGGNLQKLLLARALALGPRILIAQQPTRGLDVAATGEIHRRLLAERERGTAMLLISEDLEEILGLADRIAVMYEGRLMGIVAAEEARVERIGLMMAGVPL